MTQLRSLAARVNRQATVSSLSLTTRHPDLVVALGGGPATGRHEPQDPRRARWRFRQVPLAEAADSGLRLDPLGAVRAPLHLIGRRDAVDQKEQAPEDRPLTTPAAEPTTGENPFRRAAAYPTAPPVDQNTMS
jgi:hypothetical protein